VSSSISVEPIASVFLTVLLVYLFALAVLTYLSYKKTDTLREFFIMGGTAGSLLTGSAYFATQFSMSSLVGVPGTLSNVGFAGLGIILSVAMFSMAFGVLVAGGRLQGLSRKLDLLTTARQFAAEGYNLALTDVRSEGLARVTAELENIAPRTFQGTCDTATYNEVQRLARQILGEFKGVDVLVNNAGVSQPKGVLELAEEEWDRTININLKGAFNWLSLKEGTRLEWIRIAPSS